MTTVSLRGKGLESNGFRRPRDDDLTPRFFPPGRDMHSLLSVPYGTYGLCIRVSLRLEELAPGRAAPGTVSSGLFPPAR